MDGVSSVRPLVSLLTDFGSVDPYVAEMKAVIFSISPQARVVDVSHEVGKFDVGMGAFLLAEAAPYFPEGTVHVAVVDPGVGGSRRAIAIKSRRGSYVGPDNGLLIPAAESDGIMNVFEITNPSMMRAEVSSTFHGRDIFAPTAAHLACGRPMEECGREITDYAKAPYGEPVVKGGSVKCEVLHVDGFGNVVTNLNRSCLEQFRTVQGRKLTLSFRRKRLSARVVRGFSDLREGEVGLVLGSHGFLEIVCREGNAGKRLRIRRGIVVRLSGF